jgi:hypothetical protein
MAIMNYELRRVKCIVTVFEGGSQKVRIPGPWTEYQTKGTKQGIQPTAIFSFLCECQ